VLVHAHPPIRHTRASTDSNTPAAWASVLVLGMATDDVQELLDPAALVQPMLSELRAWSQEYGQRRWEVMKVRLLPLYCGTRG
jgi:hypothetical protein